MVRAEPENGNPNPSLIRALWNSIEQAVCPIIPVRERQGQYGKRWLMNFNRTITSTQSSLYIYIENNTDDLSLDVEGVKMYTTKQITLSLYDEPTVDVSTFTSDEFRNTRSSVTKDPPWNIYVGTENNVTISDNGRLFAEESMDAGNTSNIGRDFTAPGYIIDPNSSALIRVKNDTSNDTGISFSSYCHEQVTAPDLTLLEGSN